MSVSAVGTLNTVGVYNTVVNTVYNTVVNTVYNTVYNTVVNTVYNTVYNTVVNTVYNTVVNTVVNTVGVGVPFMELVPLSALHPSLFIQTILLFALTKG